MARWQGNGGKIQLESILSTSERAKLGSHRLHIAAKPIVVCIFLYYVHIMNVVSIHIIMPTIQHFLGIFISMISSRVIFVTSLDVSHVHLEAGPGLAHRTTPLASVESRLSVIH